MKDEFGLHSDITMKLSIEINDLSHDELEPIGQPSNPSIFSPFPGVSLLLPGAPLLRSCVTVPLPGGGVIDEGVAVELAWCPRISTEVTHLQLPCTVHLALKYTRTVASTSPFLAMAVLYHSHGTAEGLLSLGEHLLYTHDITSHEGSATVWGLPCKLGANGPLVALRTQCNTFFPKLQTASLLLMLMIPCPQIWLDSKLRSQASGLSKTKAPSA